MAHRQFIQGDDSGFAAPFLPALPHHVRDGTAILMCGANVLTPSLDSLKTAKFAPFVTSLTIQCQEGLSLSQLALPNCQHLFVCSETHIRGHLDLPQARTVELRADDQLILGKLQLGTSIQTLTLVAVEIRGEFLHTCDPPLTTLKSLTIACNTFTAQRLLVGFSGGFLTALTIEIRNVERSVFNLEDICCLGAPRATLNITHNTMKLTLKP